MSHAYCRLVCSGSWKTVVLLVTSALNRLLMTLNFGISLTYVVKNE